MKNLFFNSLNKAKLSSLIYTLGILFGTLINPQIALADLSVAPTYMQLEAEKVQTTGFLVVGNTSDNPIRVRASITSFTYDENGNFIRQETGNKWDLSSYVRFSPKEVTIPPKSNRRIRFAALMPPSLPDGEYRVAIFVETLSAQNVNQEENVYRVNFLTRIGSAIYVKKGNLEPDLKVKQVFFNQEKKELRLTVANQGTATAKTLINWQLSQNNQEIIKGTGGASFLPEKTVNALLTPESKKALDLKPGTYQLTGELIWVDDSQKKQSFTVNLEVK